MKKYTSASSARFHRRWTTVASTVTVLIMTFALPTFSQDNFYFSVQPKDLNVISGHSATLDCNVSNTKNIIFYWTLSGETFSNTTRRYQNGSNLVITRVDREKDLGEFKCIAMNISTGFSMSSSAASLNIFWLEEQATVQLQSPESKDLLKEGDELVLRCKVEGSPEIVVEWYRNSVRLFRSERMPIRNRRLHIHGITALDNGIYSCRATNDAGAVDSVDNFALTLPHPLAAQIIQLPDDITVKKNSPARFDCLYKDAAVTEWYIRDEGPLSNDTRFTIFSNGSLFIHRVRGSDEGLYKCVGIRGTSDDEPVQTYTAELRIAAMGDLDKDSFEPPVSANQMSVVPENKEYEITCKRPSGHPRPTVWWEDPSGKVISDAGHVRVDDTRLIIISAKKEDAGNYTCVAENMAATKKSNIRLFVSVLPTITTNPVGTSVEEGERAQLSCEYKGSPHPITTVTWLKDKKFIREDSIHHIVHAHNGTLQINSVQLMDNGSYVCEVHTAGFPAIHSQPAVITVKEKLKFLPVPINKKLELGVPGKIHCRATGTSKPVVRWIKEGQPFFKLPDHVHDENGTLYFDTANVDDAGRYTCIATNVQGIINVTIQVDVIVTPKFTVKPTNTEAYEGYPVMIHCKASGDPHPTIKWDKNSILNSLDWNRFRVLENGTLYVTEAHMDDQGQYGCTAGNSGGFKREEISLVVKSSENYVPARDMSDSKEERQEENMMTKTVTITLGAAAAYMLLVVGLMMWCRYRRAKQKAAYLQQSSAEGTMLNKAENGDVPHGAEMRDGAPIREYKDNVKSDGEGHSHSSGHSQHSKRSRASYDRLQFPRHDLQTVMLLGKGEFGDIFLAKARGIHDGESETVVMVKSLQSTEDGAHFNFKREIDMYSKMSHPQVARLLGVCREVDPHFMIMEYSDWGDLKQFLLATRKDNPRKSPRPAQLTIAQIVAMASQVVQGMEYLANHRYIHRDLAARNCLVTSKLDIKVSNPSLSRDTYAREYCRLRNQTIPLRWMAPEVVNEDEYSTKSDVWSFAVLVMELFTQAELPHGDKSDDVFIKLLKAKEISWDIPDQCPEALQVLMRKCWSDSPKDRPTFSDLNVQIGEINIDSHV